MSELKIAKPPIEKVDRTPVVFKNEETGLMLAGIIYRPRNRKEGEKLPAVVIGGPMLSAKELVQSLYGQLLAEQGYYCNSNGRRRSDLFLDSKRRRYE